MTAPNNLPNGPSPERFTKALATLGSVCALDAGTVGSSLDLAYALQGVSRSVLDIVQAKGVTGDPDDDLESEYALSSTKSTELTVGKRLPAIVNDTETMVYPPQVKQVTAYPNPHEGSDRSAQIRMEKIDLKGVRFILCSMTLPSDRTLDRLLSEDPALWCDGGIRAADLRQRPTSHFTPFHNTLHTPEAPQGYLRLLQELGGHLLTTARML